MFERSLQDCTELRIAVPQHPDLALICTAPDRYPPELIQELASRLEQWATHATASPPHVPERITPTQIKKLLRAIHVQEALAEHPPAQHPNDNTPQSSACLALLMRAAIAELEQPVAEAEPDPRGTILRMRFLERYRAKAVMKRLNVSERHFYRLQAEGLKWLAERLMCHVSSP